MKRLSIGGRAGAMIAVLAALLALFLALALRSGSLAPVAVTVTEVESRSIQPMRFGIGTVEARHTHRVGPTAAGRVLTVLVEVGDRVTADQLLGELDPVDLDDRRRAQSAAREGAGAAVRAAEARVRDAAARRVLADTQAARYERLARETVVSQEALDLKRHDRSVAAATVAGAAADLDAALRESARATADLDALTRQRSHLRLFSPIDGLVVRRDIEPGTTVVAGQPVVEIIDPLSLWVNARFEQLLTSGLEAGLEARVTLRSRGAAVLHGSVLRVEPLADMVTEETLAKITFDQRPDPLPPVGELAEVTVVLPALAASAVVPNASLHRVDGRLGVWALDGKALRFAPVTLGEADLDGNVAVLAGVTPGERIVLHSQRELGARSRIKIVASMPGVAP